MGATLERPGTVQRGGGRQAMTVLRPKAASYSQQDSGPPIVPLLLLGTEQSQSKLGNSQQRRISKVLGAKVVSDTSLHQLTGNES